MQRSATTRAASGLPSARASRDVAGFTERTAAEMQALSKPAAEVATLSLLPAERGPGGQRHYPGSAVDRVGCGT